MIARFRSALRLAVEHLVSWLFAFCALVCVGGQAAGLLPEFAFEKSVRLMRVVCWVLLRFLLWWLLAFACLRLFFR